MEQNRSHQRKAGNDTSDDELLRCEKLSAADDHFTCTQTDGIGLVHYMSPVPLAVNRRSRRFINVTLSAASI